MTENEKIPGDETPEAAGPLASTPVVLKEEQSLIENMEVHHHPHVGKKNFKEYFLEFLMIFLAVTLGFLAENLREHIGDKGKEREYIESLISDLKEDTLATGRSAANIFLQIAEIDTLENVLALPNLANNDTAIMKAYTLNLYVENEHTVNFNERTITQLVSSGNMRLIKQNVSDSIMDYFAYTKSIDNQRAFYLEYIKKCMEQVQDFYDFAYLQTSFSVKDSTYDLIRTGQGKRHLLTTSSAEINKFNTTIEFTKRIIYSYMWDIIHAKLRASKLLAYLQKEYE